MESEMSTRFDLVDLQLFIAVAETRSITAGAARVHRAHTLQRGPAGAGRAAARRTRKPPPGRFPGGREPRLRRTDHLERAACACHGARSKARRAAALSRAAEQF